MLFSNFSQLHNIVYDPMREVGGRTDDHDSIGIDQTFEVLQIDTHIGGEFGLSHFDVEVEAALVEGCVGCAGDNTKL